MTPSPLPQEQRFGLCTSPHFDGAPYPVTFREGDRSAEVECPYCGEEHFVRRESTMAKRETA